MKKTLLAVLLFMLLPFSPAAADDQEEEKGVGLTMGVAVRLMDDFEFIAADIPFWDGYLFPVGGKYFQVSFGLHGLWGISEFFFDPTVAMSLHLYPAGKILSFHGTGHLGSYLLNNLTLMGGGGIDIDIPVRKHTNIFIGVEYFYRKVWELAEFILKDRGEWYITSSGLAIRIGLRFREPFILAPEIEL
jgi:hypothetical protein